VKSNKPIIAAFLFFVGVVLFSSSAYRLNEWQQAIIIQLGKPVRDPVKEAGLHFKIPFIETVERVDKRILNWDGNPNQIPTKDKKYIDVDTTARWRIIDPLSFIQSVRDEDGAKARLTAILDSATRDVISNQNLVEAVRNSDAIIEKVKERAEMAARGELSPDEEEVTGELEKITIGRERLSQMIKEKAATEIVELGIGIELIDVQLRRISYESSVERKVYERMIAERQRIAQKIRAVGQGEKAKIEGKIKKDLQKIESKAYSKAQIIMGKADAKAIAIYASSMNADPNFYEFLRTLEAYRKGLPSGTRLILSTESKFLELLRKK